MLPHAIILLSLAQAAAAAEWPTYRHDNRRSGVSAEELAFPLEPRWTHRGGTPRQAWSGPAKWDAYSGNAGLQSMRNFDPCHYLTIANGLAYYGSSHDNAVHALDAATGEERWVFFAEAPVRLPPTIFEGAAYVGSDDGFLYALDAGSGDLLWKDRGSPEERRIPSNASLISLWPVRTSALVANGSLYYAASLTPWESSWLVAVDPKTGQRRFARELSGVTLQGALLATARTLIAPQGRSSPLLFSAETGEAAGTIGHAGGVFCLVTEDEQILAGPNSQKPKDSQLLLTNPEGKKVATFNDTNRAVMAEGTAYLHTRGSLKAIRF
ncbi:MAG: PQQ-binding-like beta-propeller repeat protein, partial [Akkermansiaceae bacterium]|nr:PQQ-binding-like beta-propeller repeat protein [Akkermansiaceae bacterium]